MAHSFKYAANDALKVIDGPLTSELGIHRFDPKTRTKVHLFSVKGPLGRQFGLVLGDKDAQTGRFKAQQTRIVLERCEVPGMDGLEQIHEFNNGSRLKQSDSKIGAPNQANFLVADETALTRLLRWYTDGTR